MQENSLKPLREVLRTNEAPEVIRKYFISLPTEAHHKCHPTKGALRLSQRIHPILIAKIQELVSAGIVEPVEVQRLHVNQYICVGYLPEPNDRAYFPSLETLKIT